jgi:hypothetical protein
MIPARKDMLKLVGAGFASAAALSAGRSAHAQAAEGAGIDTLSITRKGLNEALEVINVDLS